jgi:hypothetical protein
VHVSPEAFEQLEARLAEPAKVIPGLAEFLRDHGTLGPMPTPEAEPPSETVAAEINTDMRANNRRHGVEVPRMAPVSHDWEPQHPA